MRPCSDSLLIWTGAPCSYGCSTCPIDPAAVPAGLTAAELQRALAALGERHGRLAILLGGEPFLRPDFLQLVATIRAAGCVPGLVTTGRPLVYPKVREKLRRAGLAYLRVQLFGSGDTHDRTTAVPGAFAQAVAGLRAWVGDADAGCDLDVALSTRGRPLAALAAEVEQLGREIAAPGVQLVVAVDPAVSDAEAAALQPAVAALADWNADPSRPLLAWEGLPDAVAAGPAFTVAPPPPGFVGTAPRACCLGPIEALARAAAGRHQQTRANSFNFIRTPTSVPWSADAAGCTAYAAGDGGDPARQLWLADGGELARYDTDTGDFDPAEIARVKDEWSHLFVDRAPAGMLDDFTHGMRRVLPDATCDSCAHRGQCGRRFLIVDGPPFAQEEAWIAEYVSRLRGRVLDVGCGEQLYADRLAPLVRAGTVRYTGLDPDQPSLTRLQAALPEARLCIGGIEDFAGEPASYDHVLCLRSLNHVLDLDLAVARMAELLKPGGELLIVETTPFAMLRAAEQVAAADRAPRAGHQHFRNVTSEEILPFARRRSLRVRAHRPASRDNTNEWILLLQRPLG